MCNHIFMFVFYLCRTKLWYPFFISVEPQIRSFYLCKTTHSYRSLSKQNHALVSLFYLSKTTHSYLCSIYLEPHFRICVLSTQNPIFESLLNHTFVSLFYVRRTPFSNLCSIYLKPHICISIYVEPHICISVLSTGNYAFCLSSIDHQLTLTDTDILYSTCC